MFNLKKSRKWVNLIKVSSEDLRGRSAALSVQEVEVNGFIELIKV